MNNNHFVLAFYPKFLYGGGSFMHIDPDNVLGVDLLEWIAGAPGLLLSVDDKYRLGRKRPAPVGDGIDFLDRYGRY